MDAIEYSDIATIDAIFRTAFNFNLLLKDESDADLEVVWANITKMIKTRAANSDLIDFADVVTTMFPVEACTDGAKVTSFGSGRHEAISWSSIVIRELQSSTQKKTR